MILIYFVGGIGLVAAILPIIFHHIFADYSQLLSSISTIISIALGVVSMAYSCYSSVKTDKTLTAIKENNDALVEKIKYELSKENYGKKNIESVLKD